ncbi:hypothetical protein IQ22_04253 [Pseudomonas duriflava]|uniref:Uncharacterized protein n=1 Tax=Pseudomonas duriflava TaxID=459528 RepID=A0A562PV73_9PSED|nr:hypothetical protein [Pseudomonas duriflava]TWI48060.1 hypothetical protein IQ22_04253 [Pseudomonas duriflava]
MPDSMAREQSKTRRAWDNHGSWLLLFIVAISCFMGGSTFNASSTGQTIKIITDSYERQDAARIARIRELTDQNLALTKQVSDLAHTTAMKADEAAEKASKALDKVAPQ